MEASNLSTLSRHIIILLLYTDCQGGRTDAIARHMSFAQITCWIRQISGHLSNGFHDIRNGLV